MVVGPVLAYPAGSKVSAFASTNGELSTCTMLIWYIPWGRYPAESASAGKERGIVKRRTLCLYIHTKRKQTLPTSLYGVLHGGAGAYMCVYRCYVVAHLQVAREDGLAWWHPSKLIIRRRLGLLLCIPLCLSTSLDLFFASLPADR